MLQIPPTNLLLLAAEQEPYKKADLEKILKNFLEKSSEEWTSRQKKIKQKTVTGSLKRTRE